jgi:hypothetical protein
VKNQRELLETRLVPFQVTAKGWRALGYAIPVRIPDEAVVELVAHCAGRSAVAHERTQMLRVGSGWRCQVCGEFGTRPGGVMNEARITQRHDDLGPENPYHEWVFIGTSDDFVYGSARSHRAQGWRRWQRWVCNNPDCDGEAWVLEDAIDAVVQGWLADA